MSRHRTSSDPAVNVQLLKIPVHLAFLLDKAHGHQPLHSESNLTKCHQPSHHSNANKTSLPQNIDDFILTNFIKLIGSKNGLGCRTQPLMDPFLLKLLKREEKDTASTISELILRLLHDKNMTPLQEFVNGNYLCHMALSNPMVQQEILLQLMSQSLFYKDERGRHLLWMHIANVLSCLCPSSTIYSYVLKFVSDHGDGDYKALCQDKLLTSGNVVRCFPPSFLEWRANRMCASMALKIFFCDDESVMVAIDSFTITTFAAKRALMQRSHSPDTKYKGWSVCLEFNNHVIEAGGQGYILDPIACLDMPPFWNEIGGTCDHKVFLIAYPSDKAKTDNFSTEENGHFGYHGGEHPFNSERFKQSTDVHSDKGNHDFHSYWITHGTRANLNMPPSLHLEINENIHGLGDNNPNQGTAGPGVTNLIPPFAYDFAHPNYMYPGLFGPSTSSMGSSFSSANEKAAQIQSAMHVNQLHHNYLQSSLQTELYRSQLEAVRMGSLSSQGQPFSVQPAANSQNNNNQPSSMPSAVPKRDQMTGTNEEIQVTLQNDANGHGNHTLSQKRAADVHRIDMKQRSDVLETKIKLLMDDSKKEIKPIRRKPKKMPSFKHEAKKEPEPMPRSKQLKRSSISAQPETPVFTEEQHTPSLKDVFNVRTEKLPFRPNECYTYCHVPWFLRVRKEFLYPNEKIEEADLIDLIFYQIVRDTLINPNIRMTQSELQKMIQIMDAHSIIPVIRKLRKQNDRTKHFIIETAKSFTFYFGRFIPVKMLHSSGVLSYWLVVSHSGLRLAYKQKPIKTQERNELVCHRHINFNSMVTVEASNQNATLKLQLKKESLQFKCCYAESTKKLIDSFCKRDRRSAYHVELPTHPTPHTDHVVVPLSLSPASSIAANTESFSMLNYGLSHFKIKNSERNVIDQLSWHKIPIKVGLLEGLSEVMDKIASECSLAILTFCGDYPMETNTEKEDYLYLLLKIAHKYSDIVDEIYCQLCRQTGTTRNQDRFSIENGWLLFQIFSIFFAPSKELYPHLSAHLAQPNNKNRNAAYVLKNMRKTYKYGKRKELPLPSEVQALINGSSIKEINVKTPGLKTIVVTVGSSTIVDEVIKSLSNSLGVSNSTEIAEFSLCYITTDQQPVPMKSQNYIFDISTELERQNNKYFFFFFRSIWFTQVNPTTISEEYLNFLFDEIVNYFICGDWLIAPDGKLSQETENEITSLLVLAHHIVNNGKSPTEKSLQKLVPSYTRYLITNDVIILIQNISSMAISQAKKDFIERISQWPLFGVMNYLIKTEAPSYLAPNTNFTVAVNRHGVHFLKPDTREILDCISLKDIEHIQMVYHSGLPTVEINLIRGRKIKFSSQQAHKILYLLRQYTKVLYLATST